MVLPRSNVIRTAWRGRFPRASRTATRSQPWQQLGRRSYASGGHEAKKASSDLPWLVGAIVVTAPVCAYLLQPNPNKGHGHDEHGEGHQEHDEGHGDDKAGENSDHDQSGSEGSEGDDGDANQQDTPDSSEDESSKDGKVSGKVPQFKGPTKDGPASDDREHIPDAKGGAKKRINSSYGNRQGVAEGDKAEADAEGSAKDQAAASKPASSRNQQSGKQEGLSNTDTKHSTDVQGDEGKSKKGEGTPETSKSKGTVNPSRAQPEHRQGTGTEKD